MPFMESVERNNTDDDAAAESCECFFFLLLGTKKKQKTRHVKSLIMKFKFVGLNIFEVMVGRQLFSLSQ